MGSIITKFRGLSVKLMWLTDVDRVDLGQLRIVTVDLGFDGHKRMGRMESLTQ